MKSVNKTLSIQQYINIVNLKKHKQNAENQQQSTMSLDSPIPLNLYTPLIPVPASKVYKKLNKKRIENFAKKYNKRLENFVNSRKLQKSFTPIYDRISKQISRKNRTSTSETLIYPSLFD